MALASLITTDGSCSSTFAAVGGTAVGEPVFQLPSVIAGAPAWPCQICDAAECEVGSLSVPGASLTPSSAARKDWNAFRVLEPAFGRYGWMVAFFPPTWFQLVYVPL